MKHSTLRHPAALRFPCLARHSVESWHFPLHFHLAVLVWVLVLSLAVEDLGLIALPDYLTVGLGQFRLLVLPHRVFLVRAGRSLFEFLTGARHGQRL